MKILRVISSVNPEGGGPIEGVMQSSAVLVEHGHSIELVSVDSPKESFIKNNLFTVYALGPGKGKYSYKATFQNWLIKHVADYDAVLVQGLWQFCGYATRKACLKHNIPYYVFTHGMLDPWFKTTYPLKHLKKWLYWPWGEYRVLRDATNVFFTSEEEKVLARKSFWLYKCNELVLNYGTAGTLGNVEHQRNVFIQSYSNLKNNPFLLFLSRIHPKKGIDILIKVFASQQKNLGQTQLVIAGPDQIGWQFELEKLADSLGVADKITWTGMLSGDMKWGAYHCADAFILPSHQENFGIVVAEALSTSTPVLITNKVNIWREIESSGAGFVENDDVPGVETLLSKWLPLSDSEKLSMGE
ncbi:MAG: glycosyltransferase, partial [Colwellia sp.]|nr:glycosyltransferase [Colwellia sp.]